MARASDSKSAAGPVVFRDKEFKSRTIVPPGGGAAVVVEKSRVTVDTPELIAYFDNRTDFERVPVAAE